MSLLGSLRGVCGSDFAGSTASPAPLPYLANLAVVLAVLLSHRLLRWDPALLALLLSLGSVLGLLGSDPGYVSEPPTSSSSRFCDR